MSMKNLIKFGDYVPPAPSSCAESSPDTVKDYNMANGNILRFMVRQSALQLTLTFQMTKARLDEFEDNVRTGEELNVWYLGNTYKMLVTAYSKTVNNVRQKGNYTINITLKESSR